MLKSVKDIPPPPPPPPPAESSTPLLSDSSEMSDTESLTKEPDPFKSTKTSPVESTLRTEVPIVNEFPLKYKSLNLFVGLPRSIVSSPRGSKSPITVP